MDLSLLKPYGVRVLVKLLPVKEKQTEGGLYLADMHAEQSRIGEVWAVGDEANEFEKGDQILISYNAGIVLHFPEMHILDDTLRILSKHEILGKI